MFVSWSSAIGRGNLNGKHTLVHGLGKYVKLGLVKSLLHLWISPLKWFRSLLLPCEINWGVSGSVTFLFQCANFCNLYLFYFFSSSWTVQNDMQDEIIRSQRWILILFRLPCWAHEQTAALLINQGLITQNKKGGSILPAGTGRLIPFCLGPQ